MAHVAEVRHARAAAGDYADEVLAALLALHVVVEAAERLDGVVRLLAGEGDLVLGVVVAVAVAAKHQVRRELRQLQTAGKAVGIGVEDDRAGAGFKHEAGVSVPCKFHKSPPPENLLYKYSTARSGPQQAVDRRGQKW